jgi:hypothetical protein
MKRQVICAKHVAASDINYVIAVAVYRQSWRSKRYPRKDSVKSEPIGTVNCNVAVMRTIYSNWELSVKSQKG